MTDQTPTANTYPPSAELSASANVDAAQYDAMYAQSVADPEGFWAEQAKRL
uniref:acetyl-coenzyme A synthetase N-terminal domain-containing protein n=1 Tax=Pacificoceanicola onchidii TaxID=2562685 RepID=UPI0010A66FE1